MSPQPEPPLVIPDPPAAPLDVRAIPAQLVALVRGILLGSALAAVDALVVLVREGGELGARQLWIVAGTAVGRFLVEGLVLDRKAPASASALGGDVAQTSKAKIVAEGIEAINQLPEVQAAAAATIVAPSSSLDVELLFPPAVLRAAAAAAMPRSTADSRSRYAAATIEYLTAHRDRAV